MSKSNGHLGYAAILAAEDLSKESVPVPEWGGNVWVRRMTATERDRFDMSFLDEKTGKPTGNMTQLRARLCQMTMCDDDGKLLFSAKDIPLLGGKSGAAVDRCFDVAQRINGIRKADVDELVKN